MTNHQLASICLTLICKSAKNRVCYQTHLNFQVSMLLAFSLNCLNDSSILCNLKDRPLQPQSSSRRTDRLWNLKKLWRTSLKSWRVSEHKICVSLKLWRSPSWVNKTIGRGMDSNSIGRNGKWTTDRNSEDSSQWARTNARDLKSTKYVVRPHWADVNSSWYLDRQSMLELERKNVAL